MQCDKPFTLTPLSGCISNPILPNAQQGLRYVHQLFSSFGTAPRVFSNTPGPGGGNYPFPTTIDPSGLMDSVVPFTTSGTFNFQLTVTDALNATCHQNFTFFINPLNTPAQLKIVGYASGEFTCNVAGSDANPLWDGTFLQKVSSSRWDISVGITNSIPNSNTPGFKNSLTGIVQWNGTNYTCTIQLFAFAVGWTGIGPSDITNPAGVYTQSSASGGWTSIPGSITIAAI